MALHGFPYCWREGACVRRLIISKTANKEQMKISTMLVEMKQHISVPCPSISELQCQALQDPGKAKEELLMLVL